MFSRFTVLVPLVSKEAAVVADALWKMFALLGPPRILQSDNGREFVNKVIKSFTELMGIDRKFIAPYTPRSNGVAERWVQSTKVILNKLMNGKVTHFDSFLPMVQYALNTKPNPVTKTKPYSLMFGRATNGFADYANAEWSPQAIEELVSKVDELAEIVYPTVADVVSHRRRHTVRKGNNKRVKGSVLEVGSFVFLTDPQRRSKLEARRIGPFKVTERTGRGLYKLIDSKESTLPSEYPRDQLFLYCTPNDNNKFIDREALSDITYEVEAIRDHRQGDDGTMEYLVHWAGYTDAMDSWEPEGNFEEADIIAEYWKHIQTKLGKMPQKRGRGRRPK